MPCRLSKEEIVTLQVLDKKEKTKVEIAALLGVTEGTVRYHLKRMQRGTTDGRSNKTFMAEAFSEPIEAWFEARQGDSRPVNVRDLYDHLIEQHAYPGSYRSLLRYIRRKYPRPRIRTYRRVETPPGAQSQTDWGEFPAVNIGQGPERLSAFFMTLSHSRMPAVIWRRRKDQLSWIESHNEAFDRLGGVAAVNRVDNVKTAIASGAGAWGQINPVYRAYARLMKFHIDACQPRAANAKGKVEAKVHLGRLRVDPGRRCFDNLEHLQAWSDERILRWAEKAVCPATGRRVRDSWESELGRLRPVEQLPKPFDIVVTRAVQKDCMISFEGRSYPVPFAFVGGTVEVRGCAETVQIWKDGTLLREHPRRTSERIIFDPSCYRGEATDEVLPPLPLGRMGQKLEELMRMPVEQRPLDLYAALAEVAR
jgi:transposase